jgi:hypothetical protein
MYGEYEMRNEKWELSISIYNINTRMTFTHLIHGAVSPVVYMYGGLRIPTNIGDHAHVVLQRVQINCVHLINNKPSHPDRNTLDAQFQYPQFICSTPSP